MAKTTVPWVGGQHQHNQRHIAALRKRGIDVDVFELFDSAIQRFREVPYRLILTDLDIAPGGYDDSMMRLIMSRGVPICYRYVGAHIIELTRGTRANRRTPIVVLGCTDERDDSFGRCRDVHQFCREAGANEYIYTGVATSDFVNTVQKYLQ